MSLTLLATVLFGDATIIENVLPLDHSMVMLLGMGLVGLFGVGGVGKRK